MSTWTDQLYKLNQRIQRGGKYIIAHDRYTCNEDENNWVLMDYDHNVFWRARIRPKHDNKVIQELLNIKDREVFNHNVMMLPTVLIFNNLKGQ